MKWVMKQAAYSVAELIEVLKQLPPEARVRVLNQRGGMEVEYVGQHNEVVLK